MKLSVARKHQKQLEPEDNYLASVSDLMSALLFVFILALIVACININNATEGLKKSQASIDEILNIYHGNNVARAHLLERIRDKVLQKSEGKLHLQVDESRGVLRIPESAVTFKIGKSSLDEHNINNLNLIGSILAEELICYQQEHFDSAYCLKTNKEHRTIDAIFIEGHTDNQRYAYDVSDQKNRELSTQRSNAAYYWMIYRNKTLKSLTNPKDEHLFSLSGYGSERPLNKYDKPRADPANRRIELRVLFTPPTQEDIDKIVLRKEN